MEKDRLDPVCGMLVDPDQAPYKTRYQGSLFVFCSGHCLESFKKNPDKYLSPQPKQPAALAEEYTCPMHPQIVQNQPGNCPICGMSLEPKTVSTQSDDSEYKDMRFRFWIGAALSLPIFILAMGEMFPFFNRLVAPSLSRWLQLILSTPVVLWAGWPFFQRGWQSVVSHNLNMFSLISLGVGVAYIYSVAAFFFRPTFQHPFYIRERSLFISSLQPLLRCWFY